jgi:CTD kinase subunit gamma
VLQALQQKEFLESQAVADIEEALKDRETTAEDVGLTSPVDGDEELSKVPSQNIPRAAKGGQTQKLDKRQIEQRIEEDRERHKRLRESIWAVPTGPNGERVRIEDELSDYGDDDGLLGDEEVDEMDRGWSQACVHSREDNVGPTTNGSKSGHAVSSTNGKSNH